MTVNYPDEDAQDHLQVIGEIPGIRLSGTETTAEDLTIRENEGSVELYDESTDSTATAWNFSPVIDTDSDTDHGAADHESGGSMEINVTGLTGQLADPQPPADHDHAGDALSPSSVTVSGQTTINDDLNIQSGAEIEMGVGSDIHGTVDSNETSGDNPNFNIQAIDTQGARPDIHWRRRVDASDPTVDEAFSVWDNTNNNELFQVLESGKVDIDNGGLGVSGELGVGGGARFVGTDVTMENGAEIEFQQNSDIRAITDDTAGADGQEFNVRVSDANADTIHWRRNSADTEAFAAYNHTTSTTLFSVDDGGATRAAGVLTGGNGVVHEQRGAPTTTELPDGKRMTYTSDGSDAHSAGDLVSARNNAGTIVSQVIAAAADDA